MQQQIEDFAKSSHRVRIDGTEIIQSPIVWTRDERGHYRYWQIHVGISDSDDRPVDVTDRFIERADLPSGFVGFYWTVSGVENTTRPIVSRRTFVREGKNINRTNHTTAFTQALLEARGLFHHRLRKGGVTNKDDLLRLDVATTVDLLMSRPGPHPWRVFAMALHDVSKDENWRHVKYPCAVQPKIDGTLYIALYHAALPDRRLLLNRGISISATIDGYSRGRESYEEQDHVLAELYLALRRHPGLHLVGELWKRGYGLQEISGLSRRQCGPEANCEPAIQLDFNVFDCFRIEAPDQPYSERAQVLEEFFEAYDAECTAAKIPVKDRHVVLVPAYTASDRAEVTQFHERFLADGFEGTVIRNFGSLYEYGIDGERRSHGTMKLKPRPDAEWPVVDFKDGKGKETGAVIWVCAESDANIRIRLGIGHTAKLPPLDQRLHFSVTPNRDYEYRYKLFARLKGQPRLWQKIKGSDLTVSYSILSKNLLPQQPKGLRFRDQHIEELLI